MRGAAAFEAGPQKQHDDRADDASWLEEAARRVRSEEQVSEESADERSDDADEQGHADGQVLLPGHDQTGDCPAMIPTMMMISLSASGAAMVADAESTFRGQLAELVSPAISADQVEFALATWRHFVVRSRTRASASPPGRPGFRGPLRCPLSRRQVLPAHRFRTPGDS